jgi:hypothetical protein
LTTATVDVNNFIILDLSETSVGDEPTDPQKFVIAGTSLVSPSTYRGIPVSEDKGGGS